MRETILRPERLEELGDAICSSDRLHVRGSGTKTALARPDVVQLDMTGLSGVVEYDPGEYTISALAGTPVAEVAALLSTNGQYLPFDPPLVEAGSTLGGTVACGLSGPGRFRYGGVRDFLIGVRFVDGEGRLLRGGGRVVKNAAGFDFPKLFVGSLGQLGVLAELTFKVFPEPSAWRTVEIECAGLEESLALVTRLAASRLELAALDIDRGGRILARIGGVESALDARVDSLRQLVDSAGSVSEPAGEADIWRSAREFAWSDEDSTLVKIPLTSSVVKSLLARIEDAAGAVRYRLSSGANIAWIAWPASVSLDTLERIAEQERLDVLPLRSSEPRFRPRSVRAFSTELYARIASVLDPMSRFRRHSEGEG